MSAPADSIHRDRFFSLSTDLLGVIGVEGHFRQLNPSWEKALGHSTKDLMGRPFQDWLHADDREAVAARLQRLEATGSPGTFQARLVARDGGARRFDFQVSVLREQNLLYLIGRAAAEPRPPSDRLRLRLGSPPEGVVVVGRKGRVALIAEDTERVREALAGPGAAETVEFIVPSGALPAGRPLELSLGPPEAEGRPAAGPAGALVRSCEDAVVTRSREGMITGWNAAAQRLFGYTAEEAVGRPGTILVPPEWSVEERRLFDRAAGGERLPHYETERLRKDGSRVDVSVTSSPILAEEGAVTGVSEIARDISERKQAERQVAARLEELAASNAELQDYAFLIAHDLQEPLHMVSTYLQEVGRRLKDKIDGEESELVAFAQEGAAWMQRLIRDLLDYARIDARGKELVPTDSAAVVDQVLNNLRAAVRESGGEVTRGDLPSVRADGTQLGEVFQNLVGNALKFRGDRPPRVRVEAELRGGEWRFSVNDNGPGIDAQQARRLFRPLARLQDAGQEAPGGMGLAISKKIVERHGGRIWVESSPGRGCTFFFTIPAVDG